ncbi:hypothetical protein BG015_008537 [Linnemannia schmuckeri]|uniref:F-box domain-containing protein n=1 Tax=Linnemannia schmuckeri TaxID=64567 RepID=A0A9P5VAG4_9FUNG|nr:hypothetical protein BG015_008537 [Linnemannia schmuckeri]
MIDIPEVLRYITSYIDPKSLIACTRVSRQWNDVFIPCLWLTLDDYNNPWHRLFEAHRVSVTSSRYNVTSHGQHICYLSFAKGMVLTAALDSGIVIRLHSLMLRLTMSSWNIGNLYGDESWSTGRISTMMKAKSIEIGGHQLNDSVPVSAFDPRQAHGVMTRAHWQLPNLVSSPRITKLQQTAFVNCSQEVRQLFRVFPALERYDSGHRDMDYRKSLRANEVVQEKGRVYSIRSLILHLGDLTDFILAFLDFCRGAGHVVLAERVTESAEWSCVGLEEHDIEIAGVLRLEEAQEDLLDALIAIDKGLFTLTATTTTTTTNELGIADKENWDVAVEQIRQKLIEHGHALAPDEAAQLDFSIYDDSGFEATARHIETFEFNLVSGLAKLGSLNDIRQICFKDTNHQIEEEDAQWITDRRSIQQAHGSMSFYQYDKGSLETGRKESALFRSSNTSHPTSTQNHSSSALWFPINGVLTLPHIFGVPSTTFKSHGGAWSSLAVAATVL